MASTYLTRTPSSTGNQSTYTFSAWVKRSKISSFQGIISAFYSTSSGSRYSYLQFNDDDTITFFTGNYSTSTTTQSANKQTSRKFRDVGAWLHLVLAVDTTQGTAADRVKLYVNGVQETWDSGYAYNLDPSQNDIHFFNITTTAMQLGANEASSNFDGSMAHVHWIDGTQYAASTFGETDSTTGIWKPKTSPSVTYGTNGFFMKFENSGSMGTDSSGNTNNLTVNGTPTQTVDSPSNNFATINSLFNPDTANGSFSTTNGGLSFTTNITSTSIMGVSTLGVNSGKWYAEFKLTAEGGTGESFAGIGYDIYDNATTSMGTASSFMWNVCSNGDAKFGGSAQGVNNWSTTYAVNDIISIAMDLDNNRVYFAKNGQYANGSGSWNQAFTASPAYATITADKTYFFCAGDKSSSQNSSWTCNFGNGYFATTAVSSAGTSSSGDNSIWEYDCPSGYYGLNTKNINTYG